MPAPTERYLGTPVRCISNLRKFLHGPRSDLAVLAILRDTVRGVKDGGFLDCEAFSNMENSSMQLERRSPQFSQRFCSGIYY
eukprot:COSAG02_NODE_5416_length_4347_cov_10.934793_3_plen_82_part_00